MIWTDIDGWLSLEEGRALQMLAVNGDVLELGSYKGRSTIAMAQFARHIVSVDSHQGDSGTGPADTVAEFRKNLTDYGVSDKVDVMVGNIPDVIPMVNRKFDLVFVDDDHDEARRSTELALRCLKPGGTIAWHDWNYPYVQDAVRSLGIEPTGFRETLAWWAQPN